MKIRDISKKGPKIVDISKIAERVEPEEVAKALGAERISDVEKLLKSKIEESVVLAKTNKELYYLIRYILVSAEMQGLIRKWKADDDEFNLIFEIQVSFPIFPILIITVPLVKDND